MATKYEYYDENQDTDLVVRGNNIMGQSFTIGTTGSNVNFNITQVLFLLKKSNTPEDDLYIDLYAVDGSGLPSGNSLSSGTIGQGDLNTTLTWKTISMTSYELQASTKYVLLLSSPSSTGVNTYRIGVDYSESPTYNGGTLVYSTDGSNYYTDSDADILFEVWGDSTATGTNTQINIEDDWKAIEGMKINIGDVWKEVAGMQINIGDSWETIF